MELRFRLTIVVCYDADAVLTQPPVPKVSMPLEHPSSLRPLLIAESIVSRRLVLLSIWAGAVPSVAPPEDWRIEVR